MVWGAGYQFPWKVGRRTDGKVAPKVGDLWEGVTRCASE